MIWFLLLGAVDLAAACWLFWTRADRAEWHTRACGNKTLFMVGGKPTRCDVVKVNRRTCWVRLPDGEIVKRHLMKHGWRGVDA